MTNRVAITGMGCVSGLAQGVEATWEATLAGTGGIRPFSRTVGGQTGDDGAYAYEGVAALIDNLDASAVEARFGPRIMAHLDPVAAWALVATLEALEQAGLVGDPVLGGRTMILYGVGSGGNTTIEESYLRLFDKKATSVHPMTIPRYMTSSAASQMSMVFGVKGQALTIASACASSAHALAEGMHMIRAGRAEVVIAGGAEAPVSYGAWLGWKAVRAMTATACRPFSAGRDGMALGEGAATLVLENWDRAVARGVTILGELAGAGASSDAFHITAPSGEGAERAIREAHQDAHLALDTPVLVSSHGTGTEQNDKTEAAALNAVYGPGMADNLVIATKSAHGHLIGGAGALEFILGVLALQRGVAPPVLNWQGSDPACDVPLALGSARAIPYEALVSNSFAFGGLNSVLVARKV